MNNLMGVVLFLLASAVLSGCSTIKSTHDWILDSQRPTSDAEKHRKTFEEGRDAESQRDFRKAVAKYEDLIRQGSRYGEYGLAKLRKGDDYEKSVKYFLACAKRSICKSDFPTDSAMDSAFSAAAMAELAVIAEHDRPDVADSLCSTISDIVTPEVKIWAYTMKTNAATEKIYRDVIIAVESCRHSGEYVKVLQWPEISKAFITGESVPAGGKPLVHSPKSQYSVVRFVKTPGAVCQYDFEVRLTGNGTFGLVDDKIKSVLRNQLMKEFLDANPHVDADDVGISFPSWNRLDSTIKGTIVAMVMKVSVVRIEYNEATGRDGTTGHGKIVVRIGGSDVDAAKKLALENIEELATRKSIPIVVGRRPPPGARYRTGIERATEDGLLEIEFDTL